MIAREGSLRLNAYYGKLQKKDCVANQELHIFGRDLKISKL